MADIAIRGITKSYDGRTRAVDRVDLDIADGELLVLVGPSGCGKSTLLRMIAGLEEVTEGTVAIGGRDVTTSQPRARDVAMVFQSYALYPHMSVARNMGYPLRLAKVPRAEIARRVAELAEVLQLTEILDRKPSQLSGGQRQRVAMGRAIIRHPQVFLMDEPLSNLDAKLRVEMRAEIARLQRELAVTTVYVTHDQTEAMTMGTRVAVLRDGRLQQVDTPQRLYDEPVNLFVATFIGSPSMNVLGGTIERGTGDGLALRLGDQRLTLDGDVVAAHPRLRARAGRPVVAGIRPEAFDLAGATGAPAGTAVAATVDLVESLGAELIVHLSVAGPPARGGPWPGWAPGSGRRPATWSTWWWTRPASTCSTRRPAPRCAARRRRRRRLTPGRPTWRRPMPEPVLVAGLDVGGTKTLAVAIDATVDPGPQRSGETGVARDGGARGPRAGSPRPDDDGTAHPAVAAAVRRPTGTGGGDRLMASTAGALVALAEAAGVPVDGFAAVGVGVPGLVDRRAGTVRHAINLGLDDTPVALAGHLAALAGAPVVIDNDVNLAAVGAAVALGCRGDLAYLSVGTGLAAGLLLDGRIRRGAHGAAGEIGHLPVDPRGPVCECGQRGCLEALASGAAIAARRPAGGGALTAASDLLAAAEGGDDAARALVDEVAGHLAGAVALLAQTVDPEVVVLGGGVAEAGPGLLDALRRALRARAARSPVLAAIALADRVALVPDGVPAGAIGAALLARHHLGRASGPLASEPPLPAADDVPAGS